MTKSGINLFFFISIVFVSSLSISPALISISAGMLLLAAIIEFSLKQSVSKIDDRWIVLLPAGIYFLYVISTLISNDISGSGYDLRKNLFFLIIPVAFFLAKSFTADQKQKLFFIFSLALLITTIVTFVRWKFLSGTSNFEMHKASLVSHIRLSFQIILVIWFYFYLYKENFTVLSTAQKILLILISIYFLFYLFFQQSLTGLIALLGSIATYLFIQMLHRKGKLKILLISLFISVSVIPIGYISRVIYKFYDIETYDKSTIQKVTSHGNAYWHDFDNKLVENGRYVYLYVCDQELREEWNKISVQKYDSTGKNGFPVSATLIRYLTSKGLKKDADGVKSLTKEDIGNIENGIANVIYTGKKLSLYPRIYQTVWEYYVFTKTGYVNYQSFSQRLIYSKTALSIIRKHFWFGVGTNGWRQAFENEYRSRYPQLSKELYGSSHNQYLNYMVKFGFAGFLLIAFLLVYPIVKLKKYKDELFIIFLIFMFLANFADSNFESHVGGSFFIFFYCLFLTTDNISYLKLVQVKKTEKSME